MEEVKKESDVNPDALPVPPWKMKKEKTMDIKAAPGDKGVVMEKKSSTDVSKKRLKRIGVLSLAKTYGVMGLIMGLVIALVYGVIFFVFGSLTGESLEFGAFDSGLMKTFGVVFIVAIPFIYAIFGFISGTLGALGLNVILKITGGIELEFGD